MKMKKLICTVLTIALLISTLSLSFSVSAAETGTLLTEGQEGLLRYLNITLSGDVISYDKEITRGEMAHILARVSNVSAYTGEGSYFYDVPMTYLYAKDILALVDAGVLHGTGNGNYRPNDPISDAEICKVFAATLGYKNLEDMATYQKVARISGITDGTDQNGIVTYAEALRMAYNTLHCGMFEGVTYGDDPVGKVNEDFLAIEMYHGLVYHEGVMDGVGGSTLTHADDTIEEGQVRIGGKVYTCSEESLLGHAVVYYVKREALNKAKPEIQYIYSDEEWTSTITLDAKDVIGMDGNGKFEYWQDDNEKYVKIVDVPDVVYNGVAYPQYTAADLKPGAGSVTLIDNDGDEIYDIATVTAYEYVVVDSVNPDKNMIYGKYPEKVIGSEEQDCDLKMKYGAANAYLGVIESGDVVAIQASKNTTGTLKIRVDILAAGTVGTVEGMNNEYITIGGKTYERTSGTTVDTEPKLGETVTVYTHKGNCAAIIHAENDTYQFGYLLGITDLGTVFSSKVAVRIANRDRTLSDYNLADKINMDGTRMATDDIDAVGVCLERGANQSYRKGAEGLPYAQMLRYKLNNDGVITDIDTAYYDTAAEDEKTLRVDYCQADSIIYDGDGNQTNDPILQYIAPNLAFIDLNYATGQRTAFSVAAQGDVWKIPQDARDDVDKWTVSESLGGSHQFNSKQEGILEAYTVDEDTAVAKVAILYEPNTSGAQVSDNTSGRPGIVTGVEKVLDEDGYVVTQVKLAGISSGTTTLILPDDVAGGNNLAVGDVVDVASSNGEIAAMETLFTIKDGWVGSSHPYDKDVDNLTGYNADVHLAYGVTVSVKDKYLRHTTTLDLANTAPESYQNLYTLKASSTTFFVYDSEEPNKGVQSGNLTDVVPWKTNNATKQKTMICTVNGNLVYAYIIQ